MNLFIYEMKKILINKSRLILLAVFFTLYIVMGFSSASGISEEIDFSNEVIRSKVIEADRLVAENTGKLNREQLEESTAIATAAIDKYGRGEPLQYHLNRDPVLKFHFRYFYFGEKVDEYWNGWNEQDPSDIKGVYPLQEKLSELEVNGQTDTFEYRKYAERLETEIALGEPIFIDVEFWDAFSTKNDAIFVILFLLLPLCFFISPLFTQEVKTEMDSIVLCSLKGRREIVTLKLLAAATTAATIAAAYLSGYFIGTIIRCGDISGFDAPVRSMGITLLGALWLIFAAVVIGLALALISSLMKNQSAAFGIGIVVLLAGAMSDSLPKAIKQVLWPMVDFNFAALANIGSIFGGEKVYNLFGAPASYAAVAFVICLVLGAAACLLAYIAQKKRSVV